MRTKYILKYLSLFIQTLLFVVLTVTSVLLLTLFSSKYMKSTLIKTDYYNNLSDTIKTNMSYYIDQSGLNDSVLDDIFSIDDIKKETNNIVDAIYSNRKVVINTANIKDKLITNINAYFKSNNMEIEDQRIITDFVNQMIELYEEDVGYSGFINNYGHVFYKVSVILKLVFLVSIILISINYALGKTLLWYDKKGVILIAGALVLLLSIYYVNSQMDINNFVFYTNEVTTLIRVIVNNIMLHIKQLSVGYIVVSILLTGLQVCKKKDRKKLINILMLLFWMMAIFMLSNQPGGESTQLSNGVSKVIATFINGFFGLNSEWSSNITITLVRKVAHLTEYLILGILVINVLKDYIKANRKLLITGLLFCTMYATSDEIHQLLVPYRNGCITDVLIDTFGSVIGIMGYYLIRKKVKK